MISDKLIADRLALDINSGYWKVNDRFFFDKSECLAYASSIHDNSVSFHFFDEFYNSLNWNVEPVEELSDLYHKRAAQLRSKYDYIVVAYSGGADSSTVVDSFLDNNIHLDEIITSYPVKAIEKLKHTFDPLDRSPKNLMFEYLKAVKPKFNKIKEQFPKTKITVLDHTETAIDLINTNNLHIMPVSGFGAAPSLAGHHLIGKRLRELSEKHKKVCFLIGIDKPRLGYSTKFKKFGVFFDDVSTCWGHYTAESLSGFQPTTEYFFYSLDMPSIIVKQVHSIIKKIKPVIDENTNYQIHEIHDLYFKKNDNLILKVHHDFFKKILYPKWDVSIFQAGKPTSFFFQESAYWFTNTNLTDKKTKDYHFGQVLESCDSIDKSFIVKNRHDIPLKFIDMTTKPIPICF
jgi:hypothetical protein